ncbi:Protein of unknown function (DUF2580) [Prauserella sp. Am3]|nr:Protein of unknown function (DUF2580) [Prauserella sp. Am3]
MGFEAQIEAISKAGEAADGVAEAVRQVKPAAAVPDGPAGMKGAKALGKLAKVKEHWQGTGTTLSNGLDQYAQDLATAAQRYRESDEAARLDLGDGGGGRRPV